MQTERLEIFDVEKDIKAIDRACEILKNGGLVAIPTETVYGLAANTFNEQAIGNIFKAKGRPQDNPLIVHVSSIEMLEGLVDGLSDTAKKCAEKFWPGPFTMVLPRSNSVPSTVSAGLPTVAVRMPSNKIARAIIEKSGLPLAAPSANLSGSPSPTTAEHCLSDLDGRIDAVVISDRASVGVESTVISLCCNPPRLLRPGGVTLQRLQEILPDIVVDKAVLSEPEKGKPVASPGMKYKHYSPTAKVIMLDGELEKFCQYVNANKQNKTFALVFEGEEKFLDVPAVTLGKREDDLSQAAVLFDALRELDKRECELCFARVPRKTGVGLAVYNRLIRAAGFEVITL